MVPGAAAAARKARRLASGRPDPALVSLGVLIVGAHHGSFISERPRY
jgi:hypothetical protein